jgi:hypothetical protein
MSDLRFDPLLPPFICSITRLECLLALKTTAQGSWLQRIEVRHIRFSNYQVVNFCPRLPKDLSIEKSKK